MVVACSWSSLSVTLVYGSVGRLQEARRGGDSDVEGLMRWEWGVAEDGGFRR